MGLMRRHSVRYKVVTPPSRDPSVSSDEGGGGGGDGNAPVHSVGDLLRQAVDLVEYYAVHRHRTELELSWRSGTSPNLI